MRSTRRTDFSTAFRVPHIVHLKVEAPERAAQTEPHFLHRLIEYSNHVPPTVMADEIVAYYLFNNK